MYNKITIPSIEMSFLEKYLPSEECNIVFTPSPEGASVIAGTNNIILFATATIDEIPISYSNYKGYGPLFIFIKARQELVKYGVDCDIDILLSDGNDAYNVAIICTNQSCDLINNIYEPTQYYYDKCIGIVKTKNECIAFIDIEYYNIPVNYIALSDEDKSIIVQMVNDNLIEQKIVAIKEYVAISNTTILVVLEVCDKIKFTFEEPSLTFTKKSKTVKAEIMVLDKNFVIKILDPEYKEDLLQQAEERIVSYVDDIGYDSNFKIKFDAYRFPTITDSVGAILTYDLEFDEPFEQARQWV